MSGAFRIPSHLTDLEQFPATLAGTALKFWRTNATETLLEAIELALASFAWGADWVKVENASGVRQTTTLAAEMLSGTYDALLTDATTFAIGQGISIVGAGSAGPNANELITTINAINGNTVTVNNVAAFTAAQGNTVYHDDTAAIRTAIQAGGRIYLPRPAEGYNFTSRIDFVYSDTTFAGHDILSLAPDGSFGGYGYGSTTPHAIYSRMKTDYLLKVPDNVHHTSMAGFTIKQDPLVTPTAGGGIQVGEVGSYGIKRPQPTTLKNIGMFGTYNGLKAARQWQTFVDWLTTRFCVNVGLYVGDCDFQGGGDYNHVYAENCGFAGFHITMADHDTFSNCRTWTSGSASGAAFLVESVNPIYTLTLNNLKLDDIPAGSAGLKTRKGASVFYPIVVTNTTVNCSGTGSKPIDNGVNTTIIASKVFSYGNGTFQIDGLRTKLSECAYITGTGTAFTVGSTANGVSLKECDPHSASVGISLIAGCQNITATGNFLQNTSTPISYGTGTRSPNIRNNMGVNDWLTSIASTPDFIGQDALVGGHFYKAVGTASSADWKQTTV